MKLNDANLYMMEQSFKVKLDKAASTGDKELFEAMQKQLKWLNEYKRAKYEF